MTLEYFIKRIAQFIGIAFIAATLNFFLPRVTGQDPIQQKLAQLQMQGGSSGDNVKGLIETYNKKFGLDKPLWRQYLTYLGDMARLDLGQSISNYPTTVLSLISHALPWTLGLMGTATLLSFALGTLVGALMAWGKAPAFLRTIFPAFFTFSAVPAYLMGIILLYIFAFRLSLLPLFGGYGAERIPQMSWSFAGNVLYHSILPAAAMVIAQIGGWAMGMRSMMVTTKGEDYMLQAEAKGLKWRRVFLRYAVRNAILPQVTAFALSLGTIISGGIVVESVFSYPGIGTVLSNAIRGFDWFVIQGIVFMVILTVAFTMLIIDLIYPLLDPRISYRSE